jgi:hypothetical protein
VSAQLLITCSLCDYGHKTEDSFSSCGQQEILQNLMEASNSADYAVRSSPPPNMLNYEYNTFEQLLYAIHDGTIALRYPVGIMMSQIALIADVSQRREQYLLFKDYCNIVIELCKAANPAIGQLLVDKIDRFETLLLSTEQHLAEVHLQDTPENILPLSPASSILETTLWSSSNITGYSSDSSSNTSESPTAPQTPDIKEHRQQHYGIK